MAFNSVSGLEMSSETIEYKDGTGGVFQMPGQASMLTISLRRGILAGSNDLYDWMQSINLSQVSKKDISISLTDETGSQLLVTWNIVNAFPVKLSAPGFDASSNEVSVEELVLMAESMAVQFH